MGHDTFRVGFYHRPILNFHVHRHTAIQAGSVDLNQFPRKEPANCQRLKTSLTKPFLLALYCDPVLGGQVAEGGKAANIVSVRK
jgi:hypothetical protein